jgi:7,8-dihydroneopterin aldolase/epimerase/oxygenase
MSDYISLQGITAFGFHGVFPEERRDGQVFYCDLKLESPLANLNDDINRATNYASIVELVDEEIRGEPVNLIETLAERIAVRVLHDFPQITRVIVTVHKPHAPVSVAVGDISVTIERAR